MRFINSLERLLFSHKGRKHMLSLLLQEFDREKTLQDIRDYEDNFKDVRVASRQKSVTYSNEKSNKTIKLYNGESMFGPSENWPAQLQPFGGLIANEVKNGNIPVTSETFSSKTIHSLLKTYRT
jgi:hypothetical protein